MDAKKVNDVEPARQMLLRSQGPVDQLDTTQLSPAGSYIRSYNHNGHSNVNASYHTVSLKIKERRRELVVIIVALLGNDPRYWFEPSLRPVALPVRPLDWSTTLLQRLRVFAQSLPCDPRSTTIEQRLKLAHQKMLAEASGAYDCSANSVNTQQPDDPSQESNEHYKYDQHSLNKVQAMREEIAELEGEKWRDEMDLEVLENRLKDRPKLELEVFHLRERNAWLEYDFAVRNRQASSDQIQAAIAEHQRALGFS